MASKTGGGLTLVAAVAVVGLIYGNTDLGGDGEAEQAAVEQPAHKQADQDTNDAHSEEGFADTLRRVIGQDGAGSSDSIGSFFENTDPGGGDGWSLDEHKKDDKGVWDYAEEYGVDRPNQKAGGAANAPAQPATDPAPADTANGRIVQGRYMTINLDESYRQLDGLEVKGRAPKTGYSRDQFGQAWSDDVTVEGGHNGCDTRQDRLKAQLTDVVIKPGTNDCVVLTGKLDDPYTGKTIDFKRGKDTSRAIQLDHVVALSDSWQKGAQQWDEGTRRNFANDPINLIAVDGPANASKGDGDAATWQPPNKAFRCEYAAMQIRVKSTYGLWVTQAERDALQANLDRC